MTDEDVTSDHEIRAECLGYVARGAEALEAIAVDWFFEVDSTNITRVDETVERGRFHEVNIIPAVFKTWNNAVHHFKRNGVDYYGPLLHHEGALLSFSRGYEVDALHQFPLAMNTTLVECWQDLILGMKMRSPFFKTLPGGGSRYLMIRDHSYEPPVNKTPGVKPFYLNPANDPSSPFVAPPTSM